MSFPPKKKLEILIAYWESGRKVSSIAEKYGVSREIIRRWHTLLTGTCEFVYKDDVKSSPKRKLEAVIAYYESGRQVHGVAKRFEVSVETIRSWAIQLVEAADHVFSHRGSAGEILRLRKALAFRNEDVSELDRKSVV